MRPSSLLPALLFTVVTSCAPRAPLEAPAPATTGVNPAAPLTAAQQLWVERVEGTSAKQRRYLACARE